MSESVFSILLFFQHWVIENGETKDLPVDVRYPDPNVSVNMIRYLP